MNTETHATADDPSADKPGMENETEPSARPGEKEAPTSEVGRRGLFKALASLPLLGAFGAAVWSRRSADAEKKRRIVEDLGVSEEAPAIVPQATSSAPSDRIRVGIIGFGGEGEALIRAAGFPHPEVIEEWRAGARDNPRDRRLVNYLAHSDLNLQLTAVCDVFDIRAERAMAASESEDRFGGGRVYGRAHRYRNYQDLLESGEVDAVFIATPDHWHARMTAAAAAAGVHVYCEKCMTRTAKEVAPMVEAVKASKIKFQLGHQNRQLESHEKAREILDKDILGPVTLIEVTTNRNSPWGAWVWDIHPEGSPKTIDWKQFQGAAASQVPFSLERFFRWRCWFDYGTGLAGDLLSHEYDAINQMMRLGIPNSAVASGGIYFFKDGRDVPDVFQVAYEYPDRNLTLVYSATLANGRGRGKVFMGHDAAMEVGSGLRVIADAESTRYAEMLEEKIVDTDLPMLSYRPGFKGIDAVTSATEEYFASRGLLFTYRGGQRVSTHWLHIKNWLDCIRSGGQPACDIDQGFEEAITCHMATESYRLGRKVEWDATSQKIVPA